MSVTNLGFLMIYRCIIGLIIVLLLPFLVQIYDLVSDIQKKSPFFPSYLTELLVSLHAENARNARSPSKKLSKT